MTLDLRDACQTSPRRVGNAGFGALNGGSPERDYVPVTLMSPSPKSDAIETTTTLFVGSLIFIIGIKWLVYEDIHIMILQNQLSIL